ncbi:2-amino-4-hydroxy-6-hydroxymethyldihydropteridine diphosphokinase [Paracoccus cavernae]|uniref:2-amino-4-hydroxy-6- hydroxymethyldihydropteridine diphosphokinase n=1 Tax=Paracoccus cavernae TaxID=1571207 RepID=UPI003636103F
MSATAGAGGAGIDLDLLALGGQVFPDEQGQTAWRDLPLEEQMRRAPEELILPHPRLQDRGFVLAPLAEVAPLWRHPIIGATVAEMLTALPSASFEECGRWLLDFIGSSNHLPVFASPAESKSKVTDGPRYSRRLRRQGSQPL